MVPDRRSGKDCEAGADLDSPPSLVLVVDDEPENIEIMKRACRGMHRVWAATGAAEVLETFQPGMVDAVFSDFLMPGMNGADLIRRIKALDPPVECTLVTAYAELPEVTSMGETGLLKRVMVKPVSVDMLRSCIAMSVLCTRLRRSVQALSKP